MLKRNVSNKKYQIDALDGLRGVAVLMVVFSHTSNKQMFFLPFLNLRGIGKSGVFLFFLLSSFLLTLPLLHKGKKIFSFPVMSHYWQRRFFRIYPLYTIYLLLGVISTLIVDSCGEGGIVIPFKLDWSGLLNHLMLIEGKKVTWSIAVEFKFYFILPFLVLLVVLIRPYGHLFTTGIFVFLLVLSQVVSPQGDSSLNDTRILPYIPIFITGIFLAFIQDAINKSESNKTINTVLKYAGYFGVVGIITMTPLAFSVIGYEVDKTYFHKEFILYAVFWSFVILSAINVKGWIQWFLESYILKFYGAISFSLYLLHIVFVNVLENMGVDGYTGAWLVLMGSTVAAYISFRALEEPLSRYKIIGKTHCAFRK